MSRSFKTLMHILYFAFVLVVEAAVWFWLSPMIGGSAVFVLLVIFAVLMMLYAIIFRGWRPSPNGGGDFISDSHDFFGSI